jgi:LacI family transcriptional regulator
MKTVQCSPLGPTNSGDTATLSPCEGRRKFRTSFTSLHEIPGPSLQIPQKEEIELGASRRPRVAVCIDTCDGPGRERLVEVYEFATCRDWNLLLVRHDDEDAIERIVEMRVDGAILYDRSERFHRRLRENGVFCVETSSRNLELDDAAIYVDDFAVGEAAAQHLAGLKLEHFAYCGLSSRPVPSSGRGFGYYSYLEKCGFAVESFIDDEGAGESSLPSLGRWLRKLPKPSGVLAFDDRMAERLLAACRWAGLRIPEDIALVGVGNDELICELMDPGLSSVRIPIREIGRLAAEAVEAHWQGKEVEPRQTLRPAELIVRASSERQLKDDPGVAAAVKLIRSRAHRPFGTDQIVEAIGIPRRTLERRFLASTGKTVHEFIIEFRLRLAKRLLRRTREPLGEVARQCGYAAPSAFIRMFAEREGCRPDAYRRNAGAFE